MTVKILVVDDSSSDRMIIKHMLSDYDILTACDGVEAMRILKEHEEINLIILDLNMPNMNGFQVLKALREDPRFKKVRTIILTNYDELDNEIKGLELGAVDYIRKPIHMNSLRARIKVHVELLNAEYKLEKRLDEQSFTFDMIFNQAPIGVAISYCPYPRKINEAIVRINPVYERITGRTKEELVSLGWAKITHPDDLDEDMSYFERLVSGEIKTYSMDKRFIKPDGSVVWVHMTVAPLTLADSFQCNHICLVQDITERKTLEKALYESERSKSVFMSHLPGLAYRCKYDHQWTMQYVSQGCYDLTGYPPESLLYNRDLAYNDLISPEYRQLLWDQWEKTLASKTPFKYEYEIVTATGAKKWVLELGQGVYNEQGEVEALEGLILDISDRKKVEDTLKYNSEHDPWTGLFNREYLVSLLDRDVKLKKNTKRALIGINLSMVHVLTANYGFQYSLSLLKKTAADLSKLCAENCILFQPRENLFVLYHYGYKDKNELMELGNRIAETLESIFVMDRINGGIGILEIDQNSENLDTDLLLRKLLIATERFVSAPGRDFRICFYDEELEILVNRERDITEILNGITRDDCEGNELFLQYQPILDLKTGSVFGFEALARLRTEKFGLVSPLEFIPIAERTRLILPVGEIVIRRAFLFLNKLHEYGYHNITVSINISIIQLLQPDFTVKLFELMKKMQINPKNVGLEITESVYASDCTSINKIIDELREAGIYIAIDDFGTGYSSLSRERELKADVMKIDKFFVEQLLHTDPDKAITGDIISMAHKLEHHTIAEGVENNSQLQYLLEHSCDKIQGYLISKPLDEVDAIEFLKKFNL